MSGAPAVFVLGKKIPLHQESGGRAPDFDPRHRVWRCRTPELGTIRVEWHARADGGVHWSIKRTWTLSCAPGVHGGKDDVRAYYRAQFVTQGQGSSLDAALKMHERSEAAVREGLR